MKIFCRLFELKEQKCFRCSRFKMLANCLLVPPISLLSTETTSDESNGTLQVKSYEIRYLRLGIYFQDTYKLVLQWMFASSSILWQIGDLLMRPSWTSDNFRFQNFIELFEKQQQKVTYLLEVHFFPFILKKKKTSGSVFHRKEEY